MFYCTYQYLTFILTQLLSDSAYSIQLVLENVDFQHILAHFGLFWPYFVNFPRFSIFFSILELYNTQLKFRHYFGPFVSNAANKLNLIEFEKTNYYNFSLFSHFGYFSLILADFASFPPISTDFRAFKTPIEHIQCLTIM